MHLAKKQEHAFSIALCVGLVPLAWVGFVLFHNWQCGLGEVLSASNAKQTFGLAYLLLFPHQMLFAVAFASSSVAMLRVRALGSWSILRKSLVGLIAAVFAALAATAIIEFNSAIDGKYPDPPFATRNPCIAAGQYKQLVDSGDAIQRLQSDTWGDPERKRREVESRQAELDKALTAYRTLSGGPSRFVTLSKAVFDAVTGALVGVVVLAVFVAAEQDLLRRQEIRAPLVLAVSLCAVWIPGRMMVNIIERVPFGGHALDVDVALGGIVLAFAGIPLYWYVSSATPLDTAVKVLNGLTLGAAALLATMPKQLPGLVHVVESMPVSGWLAIWILSAVCLRIVVPRSLDPRFVGQRPPRSWSGQGSRPAPRHQRR